MMRPVHHHHRGAVLPVMLLVSLSLLLAATGVLYTARADVASLAASGSIQQSRAIARSAVRAYGAELFDDQRDMLAGFAPDPREQLELFDVAGGTEIAVARLLPVGPRGELVMAEAAKLDLNSATSEMLVSTGQLDAIEAASIIAARDARPDGRFDSVLNLLAIKGDVTFDEARMYGDLSELRVLSLADGREEGVGERISDRLASQLGGDVRGLLDLFTVHAFEPNVRRDGLPRILIGSEDTGESMTFEDPEAAKYITQLQESMADYTIRDGDRLGTIAEFLAVPGNESWRGEAFDSMTHLDTEWLDGRVSINDAPAAVLQSIPGIGPEQAAAIVQFRESMDAGRRFDLNWPLNEGLVEYPAWLEAIEYLTSRSLLWRVRIVSGLVSTEDPEGPIESPVAWDVLLDCSVNPPRLVELRDVTSLELVARMLDAASDFEVFSPREIGAGEPVGLEDLEDPAAQGMFGDEPLFDDEPLFGEESLFGDEALFGEEEMFENDPLFENEPLFDDDPLFDADPENTGPGAPVGADAGRGPTGRWRPATQSGSSGRSTGSP